MADKTQKEAAKKFAEEWKGRGREDEDCRSFWIELAEDVLGIESPTKLMNFEKKVKIKGGTTKRIDVYLPEAKVMIEQKSIGINLDKPQPAHDNQTPFEQAKYYNDYLNYEEHARWIIVSNFAETRIYDMNDLQADPFVIMLDELSEKLDAFDILKRKKTDFIRYEEKISIRAGEITGKLYDALIKQYADPESEETLRSLNQLCVRLVFCLYAEDAGIFKDNQFHDYLAEYQPKHIRDALKNLFKMLDTPDNERDPDDEPSLLAFPYVNGGLFKDETIRIPQFNEEIKALLLDEASAGIDWSDISPTIFGAVFESTLNPETRRSGGMHYTSVENIHKVIDPLFLDELKAELDEILVLKQDATIKKRVAEFQKKLSELTFLDPACGSGNFLTETYLSLRRLENAALEFMYKEQMVLDTGDVIRVSIGQFNGIEINDFAVTVARTALWIAESQMMRETERIVKQQLEFLPLKTDATIVEGNALRLDWSEVIPLEKLNYIMGNPPFIGARLMGKEQKDDLMSVFGNIKNVGNLDYVTAWYKKAADLMKDTSIRTAFVSTNSVSQGEQVAILWKPLFENGIHIDFAYRTFHWDNRAKDSEGKIIKLKKKADEHMAAVHCVIIGFSVADNPKKRVIFDGDERTETVNINGYLVGADSVFIESRNKPLFDVPEIGIGNKPIDDGEYLFSSEEKEAFIKQEPLSEKYFRKWLGADEFINNRERYCLWLGECSPVDLVSMPECVKRVKAVEEFRLKSTSEGTRKIASKPTRFHVENMPNSDYILIPCHSSENRQYIPMGFITKDVLSSNAVLLMPNASLYDFGILMSSVQMAWVRVICGRIKSDYRYSKDVVYNNFPWCTPTDEQKAKIEQTAQAILDAREKYFAEAAEKGKQISLGELYGENMYLFTELYNAHIENDKAVLAAYGLPKNATESEIVAFLFKRYAELTKNKQG